MCLYTKQICPLRARKDIVCYKKFHVWNISLQTYYRLYIIAKPTENHPTLMDDTDAPLCIQKYESFIRRGVKYQICRGMIHAYKTKPVFHSSEFGYPSMGLYKCIIPKGTLYYVGTDNDICAKKMLVIEEVNPNTAG